MKNLSKAACLTLVAVLTAAVNQVLADTEIVNGIEWTYHIENGAAIVGDRELRNDGFGDYYAAICAVSEDTAGAVKIPTRLGGCPVRGIGESAFEDCALITSITIPNGVTEIGDFAFAWCEKLAKVVIPASVTEIGENAFTECVSLTSISLDSGSKSFVYSGSMLLSKNKKRLFTVSRAAKTLAIPNGVATLPQGLMTGCKKLTSVTLPASVVETVDGWADAFGYETCTSLKTITVDSKNPAVKSVNNLLIDKEDWSIAYAPAGLTSITIPSSVRSVDLYTAVKCTKVTVDSKNHYFKSSGGCVLSKDGTTFLYAPPALKAVTVPSGVKTIASWSFTDGRAESVTIPATVTQIGDDESEYISSARVFSGKTKSITFLGNPPVELWKSPLSDYAGEIRVSVYSVEAWRDFFFNAAPFLYGNVVGGIPGEPTFKYVSRETYNWGDAEDGEFEPDYGEGIVITGGSNIKGAATIPERIDGYTVTGIGRGAFKKNTKITSVSIPESVNKIGYNAFGSCTALTSVTIAGGEGVDMGQFAFSGCSGLAKNGFVVVNGVLYHYTGKGGAITIPSSVRIIDDEVFRNNKTLTSVNIPESVRIIRDEAFENCAKLTRATFSEGCKQIGDFAFYGCPLARFNVPSTASGYEWDWETVVGYSRKLKSLTISDMETMSWISSRLASGAKLNAEYTAKFNLCGGSMDEPEEIQVPYLDAIWSALPSGLPVPTRRGYDFLGWYTAKTKGTKIGLNTTVSKDVTYYAQWKPKKYKITVKATAGGKAAKSGSYDCGSTVKFTPTPNKGYVFVRWDSSELPLMDEPGYEMLWTNYAKQRRAAPLSLKIPPGALTLTAVFAKTSADSAAPSVSLGSEIHSWLIEEEPDLEIPVWVTGSLSFAPLKAENLPAGVGLKFVEDGEEYGTQYVLKVTDKSKIKPGSWNVKLSATNRSGKKSNTVKLVIVAPNKTDAVEKEAVEGLETATSDPYVFEAGVKDSFTLADLGIYAINRWKLSKVTGLPSGWTYANGKVSGIAAPGTYTVFFSFTKGKSTTQASATFVVDPLPKDVAGSYYGSAVLVDPAWDDDTIIGRITVTVSSAGKVSLSFTDPTIRKKLTFTGTGLKEIDDGYSAKVSGKVNNKSISFDVYLTNDRGASFAFNVGKTAYYSFNCYHAVGSEEPAVGGLEGKTIVDDNLTYVFGKNGSVTVTGKFIHPISNKKYTASASAQVVRDANSGNLYLPVFIQYSDGSADCICNKISAEWQGDAWSYSIYWTFPGLYGP